MDFTETLVNQRYSKLSSKMEDPLKRIPSQASDIIFTYRYAVEHKTYYQL